MKIYKALVLTVLLPIICSASAKLHIQKTTKNNYPKLSVPATLTDEPMDSLVGLIQRHNPDIFKNIALEKIAVISMSEITLKKDEVPHDFDPQDPLFKQILTLATRMGANIVEFVSDPTDKSNRLITFAYRLTYKDQFISMELLPELASMHVSIQTFESKLGG
jgi:hypothetical protein